MRLERLVRVFFWGTLLAFVGLNVFLLNSAVFDCMLAGLLGSYYNTNGGVSFMLLFAVPSTVVIYIILKSFINSIKELMHQAPQPKAHHF